MARRIAHLLAVALALAVLAVVVQRATRLPMLAVAALCWGSWYLLAHVVLPRLAHGAFRAGATAQARRRYRVLAAVSPTARDAARISIAGGYLIDRDWPRAQAALAGLDGARLPGLLRAAWLNNRAYAIARGGTADAADPLVLIDEALALRPGVPSFLHTRGLALLAAGRVDEAIRAFEAVWQTGELDPALEAERCHDLAAAWEQLGQPEYAVDYRRRARRAAPASPWAAADPGPDLGDLEQQLS